MKKIFLSVLVLAAAAELQAQTNPAITSWLINTTNIRGRHYVQNNSTPIPDTALANVRKVQYSANYAYIRSSGIPAYIIGPYLDGNPALGTNRNHLFKIPLNPAQQTGTRTNVGMGQIGIFINGVPMYNYADGRSWNNQGIWHRDAVYWEKSGFDCAKGHPSPVFSGGGPGGQLAGGTYHHHQNPTAFNLDQTVVSNICDLYLADGLYVMDSTQHSPLLGFAFDGFPIYGAYGFANANGTGGIKRIESGYRKRNITDRSTLPDGTALQASQYGPSLAQHPLGAFKEDFEFVAGSGDLDEHNGRFAMTPEYPNGIYAYYTTIDASQNSAYPYILGPTYYGVVETANFPQGPGSTSSTGVVINEPVITYTPTVLLTQEQFGKMKLAVFPNPASDLVALQVSKMLETDLAVELFDLKGRLVRKTVFNQGSTICHLDTRTLYNGQYILKISGQQFSTTAKLLIRQGE